MSSRYYFRITVWPTVILVGGYYLSKMFADKGEDRMKKIGEEIKKQNPGYYAEIQSHNKAINEALAKKIGGIASTDSSTKSVPPSK